MKILLVGKNGQLGFELRRALAPLGELVAVDRSDCDLLNLVAIRSIVRRTRPSLIVNSAAYTDVDRAETDRETAFAVNGTAPHIVGVEAARVDAPVIHYSTDYVFDGCKSGAYSETDTPNPLNVYGSSKLAGEEGLRDSGARSLILRTSWVFAARGRNFMNTMLSLSGERSELSVVSDQFGVPTPAPMLADVTAHLVRQMQRQGKADFPFGLYHVVPKGRTSWHEYARFIIDEAIKAGKFSRLAVDKVKAISSSEYPSKALRPKNSSLSTSKFVETFGVQMPDWRDGLRPVLRQLLAGA